MEEYWNEPVFRMGEATVVAEYVRTVLILIVVIRQNGHKT